MRVVCVILTELVALPLLAIAQQHSLSAAEAPPGRPEDLKAFSRESAVEVIRKYLELPPYPLLAIRRLIEPSDPLVTAALHRAYADETGLTRRQFIEAALVSLHELDAQYFEYATEAAQRAIDSDLPFPVSLSGGSPSKPVYRPEFLQVVQAHGLELTVTLIESAFELPCVPSKLFGEAADPRSFSILARGLNSPNIMIVRAAAFGLAHLHDNSVIQPFIAACTRLPLDERRMIAQTLLHFDGDHGADTGSRSLSKTKLRRMKCAIVQNQKTTA